MNESTRGNSLDYAIGELWKRGWGLVFVCLMTALSMATQEHTSYLVTPVIQARGSQASSAPAGCPR